MATVLIDVNPNKNVSNYNGSIRLDNKYAQIISHLDSKLRRIYVGKMINKGAYNNIYKFGKNNLTPSDSKLILRVSNDNSTETSRLSELKGAKIQYKLCSLCDNIANIVDFGKIYGSNKEYYMIQKYGISLKDILTSKPKYKNLGVVIKFMKNLLESIHCIHSNKYAHLDIKPSNILMKNITKTNNLTITNLDFVLIDFGGAKYFRSNNSRKVDGQMASPAFSPPEVLIGKFGKKSDTWAYGIICYLVCIRKFFFDAGGQFIFMHDNKSKLEKNIENAINEIDKQLIPKNISINSIKQYLKPLSIETIHILKDFLLKTLRVSISKRPKCTELLNHELFNLQ